MQVPPGETRVPMRITTELVALGFTLLTALAGTYVSLNNQLSIISERQTYNLGVITDIKDRLSTVESRIRSLELDNKNEVQNRLEAVGK